MLRCSAQHATAPPATCCAGGLALWACLLDLLYLTAVPRRKRPMVRIALHSWQRHPPCEPRMRPTATQPTQIGLLNCGGARLTAFCLTMGALWHIIALVAMCITLLVVSPTHRSAEVGP